MINHLLFYVLIVTLLIIIKVFPITMGRPYCISSDYYYYYSFFSSSKGRRTAGPIFLKFCILIRLQHEQTRPELGGQIFNSNEMAAILISHRVTMGKILCSDKLRTYKVYQNNNVMEKFSIHWGCHITKKFFENQLPVVMAAILNVKKIQKKS